MTEDYIIGLIVGLSLGIIFFVIDFYSEKRCFKCSTSRTREIYLSLIAGVSVAYFFLELLPQITIGLTELWLELIPFILILVGFSFVHLSEKWILQRVEKRTRDRISDLKAVERQLEQEEDNIRDFIGAEILKEDWDNLATLKRLAQVATDKHHKELELKVEEEELTKKLSEHLYKNLDLIHAITNFLYHFLIGLIIISLVMVNIISAILFFFFAFFKAEVSNITNRHVEIEGLVFHVGMGEPQLKKLIFTASILFGVITGLIIELFYPIPSIVTLALLAFISGTILYITAREILPQKSKGRPLYFLTGVFIFSIISLLLYFIEVTLL